MYIQTHKKDSTELKHERRIYEIGDKLPLSYSAMAHNAASIDQIKQTVVEMPVRLQNRNKYNAGGGLK